MENLANQFTQIKRLILNRDELAISMSDVSNITGVTSRQLRYWEEQGYIHPVSDNMSKRKYSFDTTLKIGMIKNLMDEGYILPKAAEKTGEIDTIINALHRVDAEHYNKINIVEDGLEFDLGHVQGIDAGKKLYLIVKNNQPSYFKVTG